MTLDGMTYATTGAAAVQQTLESLLTEQLGVLSRAQALEHLTESALDWKVTSGRWQVPTPGVVVTHSGPVIATQQMWVDLLSCGRGAVLGGLTAAALDGLTGNVPPRPQLIVPHGRQVTDRDDLEVHSSTLLAGDVHPIRMPPRTRLPRSIVDAASWADTDNDARAILAGAVQQRLVRVRDLQSINDRVPNRRRRRLIRVTLLDIDGGSHSLPEVEFLRLCRRYGLPTPTRQVVRTDARGRRRWLDVFWDDYGLVVEIDGMFHMSPQSWWADMWRGNDHTVAREGLLRYPGFAIREEPARVAEQLAAALTARGWVRP